MTVVDVAPLRPAAMLRGTIELPSDKSIAHRALICATLATGNSRIALREPGGDLLSTVGALRALGSDIQLGTEDRETVARVAGLGGAELGRLGAGTADCGNSGTSMRVLTGALASAAGVATVTGDESLSLRPMARLAEPLRVMGAQIDLAEGHAPVVIRGRRPLLAIDYRLTVASAQLLGAISLAALAAEGTTTITVPGFVRDHTERMLSALGADIERITNPNGTTTAIKGPSGLRSFEMGVPGDFSSAAAWLVAAAIHPEAHLELSGVGLNPTRTALIDVLRLMGANIVVEQRGEVAGEPFGDINVRGGSPLRAVTVSGADVAPMIDELPLLAVAMAAANGTSEVRGAAELRVKESDRIAAIGAALTAAGANFEELEDGWRISRGTPRDAHVVTHGDHRIAMAMAVAAWAGVASSVVLDDPDCVAISYPTFWRDARLIGALS